MNKKNIPLVFKDYLFRILHIVIKIIKLKTKRM